MRSLVWFRSDLRLEDNPALVHACRSSAGDAIAGAAGGPTVLGPAKLKLFPRQVTLAYAVGVPGEGFTVNSKSFVNR